MCCCCGDDDCGYRLREKARSCGAALCVIVVAILAAIAVAVVFVVLIFGRGLSQAKISVEDASLTRFALVTTPTTALAYNLTLALAVRNSKKNWPIGIKYAEPLEAAYSFDGQQFERVQVADEGGKLSGSKAAVYHVSSGSDEGRAVALGNAGEAEFRKQNATGVFEVEVAITGKFQYTLRWTKCKVEATCPLKLQLAPPGATAVVFQKVDCEIAKSDDKKC
ncbi:hypothetical protein U9M48_012315 [Paspalum notatum var. saurae]|uniref:Late embryogenesis abundant protein LEA-2 subgroup domain-containing protein n=1 Tax=Paspalum notatum var. saurae TaxID=547442 RepID=A0AAQ3SXB8_PASNO